MRLYVIIAAGDEDLERDELEVLYWSNVDGWTPNLASADVFGEDEKPFCSLPIGGQWLDATKELTDDS